MWWLLGKLFDMVDKKTQKDEVTPEILRLKGLEVMENLAAMLDTLDGYKAMLAERGYSETAQEAMAMDLHYSMMRSNIHE